MKQKLVIGLGLVSLLCSSACGKGGPVDSPPLFEAGVVDGQPPEAGPSECVTSEDCDNADICDGAETCLEGRCISGDPAPTGTSCDDGNLCTQGDSCRESMGCVGEALDCSDQDSACTTGICNPEDGSCMAMPLADGTSCDDADLCTSGDACSAGVCAGAAIDCSAETDMCNTGVCNPESGVCQGMPFMDGTTCDDGSLCTTEDNCSAGTCSGTAVDCSALDGLCLVGTCNGTDGTCEALAAPDGTMCDDSDLCTTSDICTEGTCAGSDTDCSAMTDMCNVGVCTPADGSCGTTPVADGTMCDDGDPATTGETCQAGTCTSIARLSPGNTTLVATRDGWSVRCLSWSGDTCTRAQLRTDCSVCMTYTECGRWHDITTYNNSERRTSMNFCTIATGNSSVVREGSGGSATSPYACGWSSSSHPICETGRATVYTGGAGIMTRLGIMLNSGYCGSTATLMTFDCTGW